MRNQKLMSGLLAITALTAMAGRAKAAYINYNVAGEFDDGRKLSGSVSLDEFSIGNSRNVNLTIAERGPGNGVKYTVNTAARRSPEPNVYFVDYVFTATDSFMEYDYRFVMSILVDSTFRLNPTSNLISSIATPTVFPTFKGASVLYIQQKTGSYNNFVALSSGTITNPLAPAVAPTPTPAAGGVALLAATTAFGSLRRRRTAVAD